MGGVLDLGQVVGPQGPQGPKGDTGSQGNTGPQGVPGANGITPNIQVGTVTTLPPGSTATVTRQTDSPDAAPVFDFGLPRGADSVNDGDMKADTYDPTGKEQDIFAYVDSKIGITNFESRIFEIIEESKTWTAPADAVDDEALVVCVGGGGNGGQSFEYNSGAIYCSGGGGGSGEVKIEKVTIVPGQEYDCVVGSNGSPYGGTTSFGDLLSAAGGEAGGAGNLITYTEPIGGQTRFYVGGKGGDGAAGGGGGYAGYADTSYGAIGGNGGNGSQFGGGGGGTAGNYDSNNPGVCKSGNGGNGGTYGGGGSPGRKLDLDTAISGTYGLGGTFGGNGGDYQTQSQDGTAFQDIISELFPFIPDAMKMSGKAYHPSGGFVGGGGGYGGEGLSGDGVGGGGYCANSGAPIGSSYSGTGGGGYCGDGGDRRDDSKDISTSDLCGGAGAGGFFGKGGSGLTKIGNNYYGGKGTGYGSGGGGGAGNTQSGVYYYPVGGGSGTPGVILIIYHRKAAE